MSNMTETSPQDSRKVWVPPENYYEQVGESDVNSTVNYIGRLAVSMYTFSAFGRIKVISTQGFEEAKPTFSEGNIIVTSTHRDERDTVMLPLALEREGIHHSRPVAKSELYAKNSLFSWFLHSVGAFAVDRNNPDFKGLNIAQDRLLSRGGNVTVYPEGTRIRNNTHNVSDIKRSIVFAAAVHDSQIVPVAFAGLSTETIGEKRDRLTVSRDKRSRFGVGPRLVFAFGDPMRFGPLPHVEDDINGRQSVKSKNALRAESKRRAAIIKSSMQQVLDMAIEYRGSSQETKL